MRKELGFGMMRLPLTEPGSQALVDMEATKSMVDHFLECGFTYFDTAFRYHDGRSETAVREALVDRHPRSSFQLATKLPIFELETEEDMRRVYEEQFEKCGVDYFDRYLIHNVNGDTIRRADSLNAWAFVLEEKKKGRLKKVGFSFHDDAAMLERVLTEHPEMEFVQLQINYLDWDDAAIQSRLCYETARRHGKDILIMEPVKGGLLAQLPPKAEAVLKEACPDLAPAELALRFAAGLEGVVLTLSGMHSETQIDENAALFLDMQPLEQAERNIIPEIVRTLREDIKVPCTACNYCSGCPVDIPISRYFALMNTRAVNKNGFCPQQMYYDNAVAQGYGRAGDCIHCHRCETNCPQQIPIVERMEEVSSVFDADPANAS